MFMLSLRYIQPWSFGREGLFNEGMGSVARGISTNLGPPVQILGGLRLGNKIHIFLIPIVWSLRISIFDSTLPYQLQDNMQGVWAVVCYTYPYLG